MARTKNTTSTARDNTPKVTNFINIDGMVLSLGDLRKADFSQIEDPKASVNSLKAWAIQLNNILRGFAQSE